MTPETSQIFSPSRGKQFNNMISTLPQQNFINDLNYVKQNKANRELHLSLDINSLESVNFFILNCSVNEIGINALLDTGATHCYMSEHVFDRIQQYSDSNIYIQPLEYEACLADGSKSKCKGIIQLQTVINEQVVFTIVTAI